MNADGHIYFTEGQVPEEDRERFREAQIVDPEEMKRRVDEIKAEVERLHAEMAE